MNNWIEVPAPCLECFEEVWDDLCSIYPPKTNITSGQIIMTWAPNM